MSAPADPPRDPPPEQPAGKRRPWAWIVVCAVLVIVAGGLVVWALSLQSDLNDQKDQTAAAEQQAQDASAQVDDINQAVSDLGDQLQQAGGEAQGKIQQAVDALKAKLADLRDQLTPPDSGGGSTGESGTSEPTATDAPAAAETATPADATSTP